MQHSDAACVLCGRARGLLYLGPVYAREEVEGLCPWCIADGSAHERFDADFTDLGLDPAFRDVRDAVCAEVSERTSGFLGWQQDHWLAHCNDAAVFLGPAVKRELDKLPKAVLEALQLGTEETIEALDRHGAPTAYLFRRRRCEAYLGYVDFD